MTGWEGYIIAFLLGMVVMAILNAVFQSPRYYR
jgi:hypothetical protein